MKRYGNIYEKIYDIDNLKLAHQNAKKGKSRYSEVAYVDENIDKCIYDIHEKLKNQTYKTSEYKIFTKIDKGKERVIYKLPYYPDRIVHWAIMLNVNEIFTKLFSDFSHASLNNKGIHSALRQIDGYLLDVANTKYCLKIDIKKFFPNVNHDILKSLLRNKFKDEKLLSLLYEIIDSIDGEKGIPIGNYLSQYFANFYLTQLDNWIKHEAKVKYVVRYMDDIVILHNDKDFLHTLREDIQKFIKNELALELKSNYQVFPVDIRGIDFVGYRHFRNYKLLRKTTLVNMKRKISKINKKSYITKRDIAVINSYDGWLKWCNSYNLKEKYMTNISNKKGVNL